MIVHTTVETFGSLEVFTKRNLTLDIASQSLPGFFWCDKLNSQGCGPFVSIHQALEHYILVVEQRRQARATSANVLPFIDPTNPPQGDLIKVDFVNRKRIS